MSIFPKEATENFVLCQIADLFSKDYCSFVHLEQDNYDFIDEERDVVLEITTAVSQSTIEMMLYEKELNKGKKGLRVSEEWVLDKSSRHILMGSGDDLTGIIHRLRDAVDAKQTKVMKRKLTLPHRRYELGIYLEDGGLLCKSDFVSRGVFDFFDKKLFDRIFILSSTKLFVWDKSTPYELRTISR